MRCASSLLKPSPGRPRGVRRPAPLVAGLAAAALVLSACGGGDDDASSSDGSTPDSAAAATTTTIARPTTTPAPTTVPPTTIAYVTAGAKVIVANASHINGSAGRMSDRLAAAGFDVGTPVNSTEGQLEVTKVYYVAGDAAAQAVADSLRLALGGGDIQVLEVTTPPPIDTGELGDATVIVALGSDTADKTLEELQGVAPPSTTAAPTTADAGSSSDATTDGSSSDATTGDATLDQAGGTGDIDT